MKILRSYLAGLFIGLGALAYLVYFDISIFMSSFLFSLGLIAVCSQGALLVTGQFSNLYDGTYGLHDIIIFFIFNILGVATIYALRIVDCIALGDIQMSSSIIIEKRDALIWYQHILKGILCGMCIEMACANYRSNKSILGIILPVMGFIIIGGQHCVADVMYYLFTPGFVWQHVLWVVLTFIGNLIGAIIIVFASQDKKFHFAL